VHATEVKQLLLLTHTTIHQVVVCEQRSSSH